MQKLRVCIRWGLLGCLFLATNLSLSAETAGGVPPPSLAELRQHRSAWPAQLTLKVPVRMIIASNGKEVGSIVSPEGTSVDLISVDEASVEIGVGATRASVPPDQTDLWERVGAAAQKPAQATTPAAAVASPKPTSPPVPASLPASPPPPSTTPPADSGGTPLLLDYEVQPQNNFSKAAFRFWSPPYTQPIRGVIVIVPGLSGDGRSGVNDQAWQDLARKYRLALVACFLQGSDYYDAAKGTGNALREALKDFAQQAAHPEISLAPLLLYGESAGGQFNYDFVLWRPEQVMAFVVNKGGYYDHIEATAHTRSIPGLFFLGQQDSDLRIKAITAIWTEGRKRGALWALAPQPNSGHEFSKTAPVARMFFDAVLRSRLPEMTSDSTNTPGMNAMQESQGWIGDLTTHEIHDGSTDSQPSRDAAWFPDESSAKSWKAFVSGGG